MKLCIDPGHGGSSPGAVGNYSKEKHLTLAISRQLGDKLKTTGIEIIMTRDDDRYVSLQERCTIANRTNCDLFISIHCNSFYNPGVTGTETFHYKGDSKGQAFATVVNDAAVSVNKNKNRGVKTADYYVLVNTKMTAILHECAFISNPQEEDMMNNPTWQDNFTTSLAAAIAKFCGYNYIPPDPGPGDIPESIPGVSEIVAKPVGYDEYLFKENRRIIHLNKYNYISLDPDGIRIYVNGRLVSEFKN